MVKKMNGVIALLLCFVISFGLAGCDHSEKSKKTKQKRQLQKPQETVRVLQKMTETMQNQSRNLKNAGNFVGNLSRTMAKSR